MSTEDPTIEEELEDSLSSDEDDPEVIYEDDDSSPENETNEE